MKTCFVDSLREGARVEDVFLLVAKSLDRARDGSLFARFTLADRTGTIEAIKWEASDASYACLKEDDFIQICGSVRSYKNRLEINIESFRRFDEEVDLRDFLPHASRDLDEMMSELRDIISSVRNPHLAQILKFFFDDPQFLEKFKMAPAAQKIHHARIGGLLEHTLSVTKNCDRLAAHYPQVNRDLLVTGGILHDIGKVEELSCGRAFRYTDSGHLVGHVVSGCLMVEKAIERVEGIPPLLGLELLHMILSHHGEKEWGSPKRPKSLQAIILHYIDDMDAKVDMFLEATKERAGQGPSIWTERHWVLDRPLLRRLYEPASLPMHEDELEIEDQAEPA